MIRLQFEGTEADTHSGSSARISTIEPVGTAVDAAEEWSRILGSLRENRDVLASRFLEFFTDGDYYNDVAVTPEDINEVAKDTMDYLIAQLGEAPIPPRLANLPTKLGRRRARQGVRLEELLEAIRIDFRVLWTSMTESADTTALAVLVSNVTFLHSVLESYVSEAQSAYLFEEARLQRDSKIVATRALSKLLKAGSAVNSVAPMVAEQMGLGLHSTYEIAFIDASTIVAAQRQLSASEAALRHLSWEYSTGVALVREQRGPKRWNTELQNVKGAYVGDVGGLAAVPEAMELARFMSMKDSSTGHQLVGQEEVWLAVASDHLADTLPGIHDRVHKGIAQLNPLEQERVLEAFLDYATTGSIKLTAANLYCHRNTIVNRLRMFREATGLDPARPVDSARALIVLARETPISASR